MIISRKSRGEKGMIEKRKGQAAMEFLMTYGWAILVVLIAIGALAYFGVLNPSRFLPESCTLSPGISCDAFQVRENTAGLNTSRVFLRNGLGQDLTAITLTAGGVAATCYPSPAPASTWIDGRVLGCGWQSPVGTIAGQRFKGTIVIQYTDANGIARTKDGELITEVEP